MPNMIEVESSNIAAVGYEKETSTLFVKYKTGVVYRYDNVPIDRFEELKNAKSVGSYMNNYIKENYTYHKI